MNQSSLDEIAGRVDSKESFLEFVAAFREEWKLASAEEARNPSPLHAPRARGWENLDLGSFLNAMAAWLESADGYYRNMRIPMDTSKASWRLVADMFMGASVHE